MPEILDTIKVVSINNVMSSNAFQYKDDRYIDVSPSLVIYPTQITDDEEHQLHIVTIKSGDSEKSIITINTLVTVPLTPEKKVSFCENPCRVPFRPNSPVKEISQRKQREAIKLMKMQKKHEKKMKKRESNLKFRENENDTSFQRRFPTKVMNYIISMKMFVDGKT